MNDKKLISSRITSFLFLVMIVGFIGCEPTNTESRPPEDDSSQDSEDKSILKYQLFNLELAAEEAYFNQKNNEGKTSESHPYVVALKALKGPCDFNCDPTDYECIQKYLDCEETTETVYRSSLSDDDGDGSDPLPPASDTSLFAVVDLTQMVIFSDDPETSGFKLVTDEGEVYASSDSSTGYLRYNKEKRQAVYKISVKNPELASKSLNIYITTMIYNRSREKRIIELKRPFGLVFRE